jgi:hypothetical protein
MNSSICTRRNGTPLLISYPRKDKQILAPGQTIVFYGIKNHSFSRLIAKHQRASPTDIGPSLRQALTNQRVLVHKLKVVFVFFAICLRRRFDEHSPGKFSEPTVD